MDNSADDAVLVQAFQGGDEAAFAELYRRYQMRVLRTAFLIVGNYPDSENVLQDTFVKAWQNLPRLQNPSLFKPWLWRILVRTAWQACSKRQKEQPVADVWEQVSVEGRLCESSDEPSCQAERSELYRTLTEAVRQLDIKHRTVIVLYYYNEMSVRDIAAATGAMTGTVKSRLFTARRILQQQLAKAENREEML